ncbi:MAG: hypothetical protein ACK4Q5_21600, partial [Saprospiraceae bacterium]
MNADETDSHRRSADGYGFSLFAFKDSLKRRRVGTDFVHFVSGFWGTQILEIFKILNADETDSHRRSADGDGFSLFAFKDSLKRRRMGTDFYWHSFWFYIVVT